jgi:hypothetical protein
MLTESEVADWPFIESLLPSGWRELAVSMNIIRKMPAHINQKVFDICPILRLVLHYVVQPGSQRHTVAAGDVAGVLQISQPAFFKWMVKIGPYLQALVARMVDPGCFASNNWGGYVLVAGDATTVQRPGSTGTTARIHYAMHLCDLRPRFIRVTDEKVGETARNFDPQPNELWILDRGYSNPPSVVHMVDAQADILVRVNRQSLPLYDRKGNRLDVLQVVTKTHRRGEPKELEVWVHSADERRLKARLCWMRLAEQDADKARENAKRDGCTEAAALRAAEYIMVLCTADASRLSCGQVLALYRARWQVELNFKRDKSLGKLDTLPNLLPQTIHSWLCAKVLLGLLARRLASQPVDIPPCGLADAILPCSQPLPTPTRRRRGAVVCHADRVSSSGRRAAADQAA